MFSEDKARVTAMALPEPLLSQAMALIDRVSAAFLMLADASLRRMLS